MEQGDLDDLDTHLEQLGKAGKLSTAQIGVWKTVSKRAKRPPQGPSTQVVLTANITSWGPGT
eukprot:2140767-Lingulodinium_polyedra.AAC.1